MKALKTVTAFSLAMMMFGCSEQVITPIKKDPVVVNLSAAEKLIISNGNDFGYKLFQKMSTYKSPNTIISPYSVSIALGMTGTGAAGETAKSIYSTLGFESLTRDEILNSYEEILSSISNTDKNVTISSAQSLWSEEGYPIKDQFTLELKTKFFAETGLFNEANVVDKINGWSNSKTNGLIPIILGSAPDNARIILMNSLYFKGLWTKSFDPKNSYSSQFSSDLQTVKAIDCIMMEANDTFSVYQNDQFSSVKIPYGNGSCEMTLYLPKKGESTEHLTSLLNSDQISTWNKNYTKQKVDIHLPKFKISYKASIKDALKALGMEVAFNESADFSPITGRKNGLGIGEVLHNTYIDVSESGTEAAATTTVIIVDTGAPTINPYLFDHPFLFTITEKNIGALLFIGKVNMPIL